MTEQTEETTRCPACNRSNALDARKCTGGTCHQVLLSELEAARATYKAVKDIRDMTAWFVVLSIIGVVVGILGALAHSGA